MDRLCHATVGNGLIEEHRFAVGVEVEVRARFDRQWKRGFEVAAVEEDRYRLRRRSDAAELHAWFSKADVRRAL
jgi:hypothetical protein